MKIPAQSQHIHDARLIAIRSKAPNASPEEIKKLEIADLEIEISAKIGTNQFTPALDDLVSLWTALVFDDQAQFDTSKKSDFAVFRHPPTGLLLAPWLKFDAVKKSLSEL